MKLFRRFTLARTNAGFLIDQVFESRRMQLIYLYECLVHGIGLMLTIAPIVLAIILASAPIAFATVFAWRLPLTIAPAIVFAAIGFAIIVAGAIAWRMIGQ